MSRGVGVVSQLALGVGRRRGSFLRKQPSASTALSGQAGGGPLLILLPSGIDSYVGRHRKNDMRMSIASQDDLRRFLSPA
jgi:hypothetical protein